MNTRSPIHRLREKFQSLTRLTLFGRSLLLVTSELLVNAVCWIVAGLLFGRHRETQPILSLALLAWVSVTSLSILEFPVVHYFLTFVKMGRL